MWILWLVLTLLFEWVGSLAIGRPVEEILIGWNIFAGYMWPYVLLTYLLSNFTVGTIFRPRREGLQDVRDVRFDPRAFSNWVPTSLVSPNVTKL